MYSGSLPKTQITWNSWLAIMVWKLLRLLVITSPPYTLYSGVAGGGGGACGFICTHFIRHCTLYVDVYLSIAVRRYVGPSCSYLSSLIMYAMFATRSQPAIHTKQFTGLLVLCSIHNIINNYYYSNIVITTISVTHPVHKLPRDATDFVLPPHLCCQFCTILL